MALPPETLLQKEYAGHLSEIKLFVCLCAFVANL
jgi:hypothetical protein